MELMEANIEHYSEVQFTHTLCPDCGRRLYPNIIVSSSDCENLRLLSGFSGCSHFGILDMRLTNFVASLTAVMTDLPRSRSHATYFC